MCALKLQVWYVCIGQNGIKPVISTLKDLLSTYSNQYLEFLANSFWFILCTYLEMCFICVPWDHRCDTSVLAKMVQIAWFGCIRTTTQYYVAAYFGPWFIHIRLVHNSRNDISIGWNICYNQIKFDQYHSVQIWLYQVTQAEFHNSDLKSWISLKLESRRYIDLHL